MINDQEQPQQIGLGTTKDNDNIIPNKQMVENYESLLQNDAVKNIMNLLSITQNTGSLLEAERIIFWLSSASQRYLEVEGTKYKRRSLTFESYQELMEKNQSYNDYKREHNTDLKNIASLNFILISDVMRIIYGIKDSNIVKRNWDQLLPIADGELYRIVNDFYNNWDLKPVMDHILEVITYTKRNLANEVIKRDEIYNKAKVENIKYQVEEIKEELKNEIPDTKPINIINRTNEKIGQANNIEIDENGNLTIS